MAANKLIPRGHRIEKVISTMLEKVVHYQVGCNRGHFTIWKSTMGITEKFGETN